MDTRNNPGARANWIAMLFCALLIPSSTPFSSAGLLNWRQESDANNAATVAIEAAKETSSLEATGLHTTIALSGPEAAAVTGTSNATNSKDTASATSAASAAAAFETHVSSLLNNTNDPNRCHVNKTVGTGEAGAEGATVNPFCKPTAGQIVLSDTEIEVTWDTSLFGANATNVLQLISLNHTGGGTTEKEVTNSSVAASVGATVLNLTSEWLNGQASTNITLSMHSSAILESANPEHQNLYGPIITLKSSKNITTSSPKSSSKKLGEEVGIPVGLVVLIVAVIAIAGFLFLRKRRAQGYGGSATRSQRLAKVTPPVGGRGHRRDASFHDEPTRGVELQNRNRGGDDNWDWGSPVSSPTGGGRESNAFREEISRQRGGS